MMLSPLTGYSDERTIIKWCEKHKIPVIPLGKKVYTVSNFLDLYIESEVKKFVETNFDYPAEIMEAIRDDNKTDLVNLLNAPATVRAKESFAIKKHSKEAEKFMR